MQQKRVKPLSILIVVLCILLLVTAAVIAGVLRYLGNWSDGPHSGTDHGSLQNYEPILPGVSICGVDVSGLTQEEASAYVAAALQSAADQETFTIVFPDRELEIQHYLNCQVPTLEAAVSEAWQYGRGIDSKLNEAREWTAEHPLALEPSVTLQLRTDVLKQSVEAYAETLDSRATDCRILESEDSIEIIKGRDGKQLDCASLCREIETAIENGEHRLEAEYTLQLSGERQLRTLHERYCTVAADACWNPETQSIQPEVPGRNFDLEQALEALRVPDGTHIVLNVERSEPDITEAILQEKLFVDELGQYSSPHTAIAPRTNNLIKACEAIDGTVLNPGDTFSFNDIVGPRSYETGYQDAAIYLNGETTDSVGGGICQVASTIYVCALQADLEIVQRAEHMYFVDYVPAGQDATIYWDGGLDFQFRNNTDYPIRVDASVSGGYVHISLWGTNEDGHYAVITSETVSVTPWETVTKEDETQPPEYEKITTTPYTGYVVNTYRNIYDADGNLLSSTFEAKSTYHKRDQVITIGKQPEPEEPLDPEDSDQMPEPEPEQPDSDSILPGDIATDPDNPDLPAEDPFAPEEPTVDPDTIPPEGIVIPDFSGNTLPGSSTESEVPGLSDSPWNSEEDNS